MRFLPLAQVHPIAAAGLFCAAIALAGSVRPGAAAADVDVHGALPGTDHSPSVAITGSGSFVLSFHREGSEATQHMLRLAGSADDGATFHPVALPALPADWYWRPNAQLSYDYGSNQVWMVGQARLVSTDGMIGVWVASGLPVDGGGIAWFEPLLLWSMPGTTVYFPTLALASGDGTSAASVLFLNMYAVRPGVVTYYRVAAYAAGFTQQDLAVNDPLLRSRTSPALAAEPGGRISAGWADLDLADPWHPSPYVVRTSTDAGATFGPVEFVAEHEYILDGPGAVTEQMQVPSLLYARHSPDFPTTRMLFWGSGWASGPISDPSDVWSVSDCCAGSAWNSPGTMLDRLPGSYELSPVVTMGEDGYFYLGWHDFQPYDPDSVSRYMVARLWNMGSSASAPVALADATFDWDDVVSLNGGMGWTSGADARGGRVLFAWGDHRGADPDVYARGFRAAGFEQTDGCGDTLEVIAGQTAHLTWRIENHNELFGDEYQYGASGTRSWTEGFEFASVSIGPDGMADVTFDIPVPDTAAAGVITMYPTTMDRARSRFCPMWLRVQSLLDAGDGIAGDGTGRGGAIALAEPRPNPSSRQGGTALAFSLPAAADVALEVHDLRGRRVATLALGERGAGDHVARWDGSGQAAGIYFARLTVRTDAGVETRTRRLVVLP